MSLPLQQNMSKHPSYNCNSVGTYSHDSLNFWQQSIVLQQQKNNNMEKENYSSQFLVKLYHSNKRPYKKIEFSNPNDEEINEIHQTPSKRVNVRDLSFIERSQLFQDLVCNFEYNNYNNCFASSNNNSQLQQQQQQYQQQQVANQPDYQINEKHFLNNNISTEQLKPVVNNSPFFTPFLMNEPSTCSHIDSVFHINNQFQQHQNYTKSNTTIINSCFKPALNSNYINSPAATTTKSINSEKFCIKEEDDSYPQQQFRVKNNFVIKSSAFKEIKNQKNNKILINIQCGVQQVKKPYKSQIEMLEDRVNKIIEANSKQLQSHDSVSETMSNNNHKTCYQQHHRQTPQTSIKSQLVEGQEYTVKRNRSYTCHFEGCGFTNRIYSTMYTHYRRKHQTLLKITSK